MLKTGGKCALFLPVNFFFPDEPGKQVKSAVKIKNTSKSYVAFKVIFPC